MSETVENFHDIPPEYKSSPIGSILPPYEPRAQSRASTYVDPEDIRAEEGLSRTNNPDPDTPKLEYYARIRSILAVLTAVLIGVVVTVVLIVYFVTHSTSSNSPYSSQAHGNNPSMQKTNLKLKFAPIAKKNLSSSLKSSSPYSYAKVDGLSLTTKEVIVSNTKVESTTLLKPYFISSDLSDPEQIISVDSDIYVNATVKFLPVVNLKAYCITKTRLIFTTSNGIASINYSPGITVLPNTYDSYSINTTQDIISTSLTSIYGIENGTLSFDPSFSFSCYDGTLSSGSPTDSDIIFPYISRASQGNLTWDLPTFDFFYLPLIFSSDLLSTNVYLFALDSAVLQGYLDSKIIDPREYSIVTVAFDQSYNPLMDSRGMLNLPFDTSKLLGNTINEKTYQFYFPDSPTSSRVLKGFKVYLEGQIGNLTLENAYGDCSSQSACSNSNCCLATPISIYYASV